MQQWELCWAVLTTVLLSLQAVSSAALERYARCIRRLANDWPSAWQLVCLADDKCRAEHLDAIKREIMVEDLTGRPTPPGWDRARPGSHETYANWNQRVGACAADGPCRYGRTHKCSRCGGDHRLLDCKTAAGG